MSCCKRYTKNRNDQGLKFVYHNSLTKKYIAGRYGNCTVSNQAYITKRYSPSPEERVGFFGESHEILKQASYLRRYGSVSRKGLARDCGQMSNRGQRRVISFRTEHPFSQFSISQSTFIRPAIYHFLY